MLPTKTASQAIEYADLLRLWSWGE